MTGRSLLIVFLVTVAFAEGALAQQAIVAKHRAQFPTPMSAAQILALEKAVAAEVHGGLLVKRDGSNCGGYSCDIVCFSDTSLFDILGDAEGVGTPQWNATTNPRGYHCELVTASTPPPAPAPVPPPSPPAASDAATADLQRQQLAALLQIVQQLQAQNAALAAGLADLKAQIGGGIRIRF